MRLFICGLALATAALAAPARAETYDHCTGFIDSVPTTIFANGVWCLRHDVTTPIASGNAVGLLVNGAVTIDCNGFAIRGTGGAATLAWGVYGFGPNAEVRNCRVEGFKTGIHMQGGVSRVVDNVLDGNTTEGIFVFGTTEIARNRVLRTGGSTVRNAGIGIVYGPNASIHDNLVDGVRGGTDPAFASGMQSRAGGGVRIVGNRVRNIAGSSGVGIDAGMAFTAVIEGNHVGGVVTGLRCINNRTVLRGNTFAGIGGDATSLCPTSDSLVIE